MNKPKRILKGVLIIGILLWVALHYDGGKNTRTTEDLMMIGGAGAGLVLSAKGKTTNDLMLIAAAVKSGGGTLSLKDCGKLLTNDLILISAAGEGHISLEF